MKAAKPKKRRPGEKEKVPELNIETPPCEWQLEQNFMYRPTPFQSVGELTGNCDAQRKKIMSNQRTLTSVLGLSPLLNHLAHNANLFFSTFFALIELIYPAAAFGSSASINKQYRFIKTSIAEFPMGGNIGWR